MSGANQFYFDPYARDLEVFLGPTEARLMELAWERGELTVKKALFYLQGETDRAYTTVMTVLNRLAEKGLLRRRKSGRSFIYTPTIDRAAFLQKRVEGVLACLRSNFKKLL